MHDVTNADRADWALTAVTNFVATTGVDTAKEAIADLIANLLHLARGRGLNIEQLMSDSFNMAQQEAAEDSDDGMVRVQARFRQLFPDDN